MGIESFPLAPLDYLAIGGFFAMLSVVGYLAGRGEQASSTEYFLAGKKLPWYVVGGSFIASNISSEHFIGMIGSAVVYGVCVAMLEWGNVVTFSLLIWFFIPFLLSAKVFTIPEFLERRFNAGPAADLCRRHGHQQRRRFPGRGPLRRRTGALKACSAGTSGSPSSALGIVSGIWAIYGGLSTVAWTDLFTVVVMILGGLTVTVLGLSALAGETDRWSTGFAL